MMREKEAEASSETDDQTRVKGELCGVCADAGAHPYPHDDAVNGGIVHAQDHLMVHRGIEIANGF